MPDLRRQENTFDSSRLAGGTVGVVGNGPVANFLCTYLAGLGIGGLCIAGHETRSTQDSREFLAIFGGDSGVKNDRIRKALRVLNPDMRVLLFTSSPRREYFKGCDAVVDTTNDPDSKYLVLRHCDELGIRYVSCSADSASASVMAYKPGSGRRISIDDVIMKQYAGEMQGSFTSGLAAALAADEIRKEACPLERDRRLEMRLNYSLGTAERFFLGRRAVLPAAPQHVTVTGLAARQKKALVIGAGGIGNYVLLGLSMLGVQVEIYDGDVVETHNLNRQLLLCGGVGKNKAQEAARKMRLINHGCRAVAHDSYFTRETMLDKLRSGTQYDAVFSCVDSWSARRLLNEYCRIAHLPLFNGGVSTFGCEVEQYIPGLSHCLECSSDYRRRVQGETGVASCAELPANVVMPNAIAGALMVGESVRVLFGADVPDLGNRKIRYDSNPVIENPFLLEGRRLYCSDRRHYTSNCRCHHEMGDGGG